MVKIQHFRSPGPVLEAEIADFFVSLLIVDSKKVVVGRSKLLGQQRLILLANDPEAFPERLLRGSKLPAADKGRRLLP